jgi:hypothetical protein
MMRSVSQALDIKGILLALEHELLSPIKSQFVEETA